MEINDDLKNTQDPAPQIIRLLKAEELLKDPSLNISQIAYDIGFSDPNYFSRLFTKAYDLSPSEYRNKLS